MVDFFYEIFYKSGPSTKEDLLTAIQKAGATLIKNIVLN